ncbi:ATP-grasp domain-containing protein [Candidatus Uabimicrobium amorphum]|uniref:Carboxylase n=1 Tax=Uabimicrobium amorphum TaxID=2596890 RepID=A0A5S9F3I1_UABAM|nr:ATP-grasp domain-containing protein [Candidatus Uabimicrobium amorphum]BBM84512.1 carboxylase [Candidatus Uabimicrobium amorphum]
MKILLIMRKGYNCHVDHIATICNLGIDIVIVTEKQQALTDQRFSAAVIIPSCSVDEAFHLIRDKIVNSGVKIAITFQETDIVLNAMVNEILQADHVPVQVAKIARNKYNQQLFLHKNNIPAPVSIPIKNIKCCEAIIDKIGLPLIVKPTQAASSLNVYFVDSLPAMEKAYRQIANFSQSGYGNYYNGDEDIVALAEEYLPGEEVTVDGVVIDGEFYLGGIHNQIHKTGKHFHSDLYSLPFSKPDLEEDLAKIAKDIVQHLGVKRALFHCDMRQDRNGKFRVMEFTLRISGAGYMYRNIRSVYGIDLVALHLLDILQDKTVLAKTKRLAPTCTTCIKFVYRTGVVFCNHVGNAKDDPHFDGYIAMAAPEDVVNHRSEHFQITGLLSVKSAGVISIRQIEEIAINLEQQLQVVVKPNFMSSYCSRHIPTV